MVSNPPKKFRFLTIKFGAFSKQSVSVLYMFKASPLAGPGWPYRQLGRPADDSFQLQLSSRLCRRCTRRAELSWAAPVLSATYITYLALEMPFRQKLLNNLAAFYSLNRKVFKCNHWQMLPRQLRRNLDSFQLLVVVFDLPVGCQHLSTKKTLLRWNQPSHLFSFSQKDFWRNRPRKSHTQRYWLTKKSKPEQLTPCWNSISSAITSQDSKPLCNISHGETADQIFPKKLSYFFSHKI